MHNGALRILGIFLLGWSLILPAKSELPPDRPVPSYDGRDAEPETTGQRLLWIPRVAFFPAYLATEYLIRWPINSFGRYAEKHKLPTQLVNFFSFGEEQQFILYPTVLVDFGFRPSVGLHFLAKKFPWDSHQLKFDVSYGGSRYYGLGVRDKIQLDTHSTLTSQFSWTQRPDLIFHGLGSMTMEADRSRFQLKKTELSIGYRNQIPKRGWYQVETGLRISDFADGSCCNDPGIEAQIAAGTFAAPPGFRGGYSSWRQAVELGWGDKASRPEEMLGVRANLGLSHNFSLRGGFRSGWVAYGGSLTGFAALNRRFRVLSFTLDGHFVRSTAGSGTPVPFTELSSLGGSRPLLGFRPARLLGESAVAATLEYRWPVWSFLDGFLNGEIGNVFGRDLSGFAWGRLRKSIGFGVKAPTENEETFSITVAFGSKPFDLGGSFDEFRFILGLTRAF